MDNYLYATKDEARIEFLRSYDDGAMFGMERLFEALDSIASAFNHLPKPHRGKISRDEKYQIAFRAAIKPIVETIKLVSDFHSSTIRNHISAAMKLWGVDDLVIEEAPDSDQYGHGAMHKLFMELMDGDLDQDYEP